MLELLTLQPDGQQRLTGQTDATPRTSDPTASFAAQLNDATGVRSDETIKPSGSQPLEAPPTIPPLLGSSQLLETGLPAANDGGLVEVPGTALPATDFTAKASVAHSGEVKLAPAAADQHPQFDKDFPSKKIPHTGPQELIISDSQSIPRADTSTSVQTNVSLKTVDLSPTLAPEVLVQKPNTETPSNIDVPAGSLPEKSRETQIQQPAPDAPSNIKASVDRFPEKAKETQVQRPASQIQIDNDVPANSSLQKPEPQAPVETVAKTSIQSNELAKNEVQRPVPQSELTSPNISELDARASSSIEVAKPAPQTVEQLSANRSSEATTRTERDAELSTKALATTATTATATATATDASSKIEHHPPGSNTLDVFAAKAPANLKTASEPSQKSNAAPEATASRSPDALKEKQTIDLSPSKNTPAPEDQTDLVVGKDVEQPAKLTERSVGQVSASAGTEEAIKTTDPKTPTQNAPARAMATALPATPAAIAATPKARTDTPKLDPQSRSSDTPGLPFETDLSVEPIETADAVTQIDAEASLTLSTGPSETDAGQAATLGTSASTPSAPTAAAPISAPGAPPPGQQPVMTAAPNDIPRILSESISNPEKEQRIVVQLDPPELGRVMIDFNLGPEGVQSVSITAENPEAIRRLREMNFELIQAMEENGLSGEAFSLEYQDRQESSARENQDDTDGENPNSRSTSQLSTAVDQQRQVSKALKLDDANLNLKL